MSDKRCFASRGVVDAFLKVLEMTKISTPEAPEVLPREAKLLARHPLTF